MQRRFGDDELSALASADLAAVVVLDADGVVRSATPSADAWIVDGRLALVTPDGAPCAPSRMPHARARVGPLVIDDLAVIRNDGVVAAVRLRSAPVAGPDGRTIHVLEVAAPDAAPEWQHRATASARLGTWHWHIPSGRLLWSDETFRLFGLRPGALSPTLDEYLARIHPDDRDRVHARILAALERPSQEWLLEHRVSSREGSIHWMECRGQIQRDADGVAVRMIGTMQDITERKRLEEAARASEARLAAILHNTPDVALQGYDLSGRVLFWNPASERMFGWSEAEAVGRTLDGLIQTPEEAATFRETLRRVHDSGQATPPTEYPFQRRNGEIGWCLSTIFQISGRGEPPAFVCMDVDQTESKRLQERMAQSERLESLGRLAGGVAHDFNNLLTSILGFTDLALEETEQPAVAEHLEHVHDAAQRGAALTQQLLAYARRQIVRPRRVDIDGMLRQMAELLPRVLHANVELVVEPAGDLPSVRLDPVQFDQIVLNLAINGSDAMPHGGRLTLSTRRVVVEAPSPADPEVPPGDWVVFEVEDDGIGMPAEVQARIFEPFFTTKATGRGTGLGLATCYGIARQNGGYITVRSEVDAGTRFRVYLPVDPGPAEEIVLPWNLAAPGGHETILVVEDDPTILELAVSVLRRRGYRVLVATHGEEAMEVAAAHPLPIDLLFTDVVMPRMGGPELADLLVAERPAMTVLLTSGYAHEVAGSPEGLPERYGFLQKPYTPGELASRVREILGGEP